MLRRISIPTAVSAAAILLAVIAVLVQLPPLLGALFGSPPDGDDPGEVIARFVEEHAENQQIDRDRFVGRSLFYPPPSWPPPPRPQVTRPRRVDPPKPVERPPSTPETPPTPTVYQGPSVNFALGGEIWFMGAGPGQEPFRVRLGEEKNGVKVISTDLPWSVKLGYRGGEFDVALLEKSDGFISGTAPEDTSGTSLLRPATPEERGEAVASVTTPDDESDRAGEDETKDEKPAVVPPRNPLRPAPAPARAESPDRDAGSPMQSPDRIGSRGRPTARPAKNDEDDKSLSDASDKTRAEPTGTGAGQPAAS